MNPVALSVGRCGWLSWSWWWPWGWVWCGTSAGPTRPHQARRPCQFPHLLLPRLRAAHCPRRRRLRHRPGRSPSGQGNPGTRASRSQQGLPAGTLYARSDDTLYALETRTGILVVTPLQLTTTDAVAMASLGDGVALRPADDSEGFLVRDGHLPAALPGQLKTADELLPGPPGRVWALKRAGGYESVDSTATLVDARGRRDGPQLTSAGSYASDGAGGLLLFDVGGTWQMYPQPLSRVTTGNVTSVGERHFQVLNCDQHHRCSDTLLDRRTGQRTRLPPRDRSYSNSLLSPGGRYLATLDFFGAAEPQTTITRVLDNHVLHALPDPANPSTSVPGSIAWLSDRWLAAISNGHLTLYDTTGDRVTDVDLPVDGLLQLTWRPS